MTKTLSVNSPLLTFRFEIDETSPSMSGCCGDDCSYEILSRRTKHGEASAGHTHGGGHCGGCCHWIHSCSWYLIGLKKKSQQLSWLCVKAWAAYKFCERHEFERSCMWFQWMERGIPGCRCWCVKEWDLYVFRCFPAAKAVSVWAFTHSYLFVVSYCLVQCQTFFLNPND